MTMLATKKSCTYGVGVGIDGQNLPDGQWAGEHRPCGRPGTWQWGEGGDWYCAAHAALVRARPEAQAQAQD